jgi:hypothetical protein
VSLAEKEETKVVEQKDSQIVFNDDKVPLDKLPKKPKQGYSLMPTYEKLVAMSVA